MSARRIQISKSKSVSCCAADRSPAISPPPIKWAPAFLATANISPAKNSHKQYGASPADIEKVRAFATQYNLKVASEDRASRTVKLSAQFKLSTTHSEPASAVTNTFRHISLPHRRPHDSRRPRRHHRRRSRPRQSPTGQAAFPSTQEKLQRATQRHKRFLLAPSSRQSLRFPLGHHRLRPMHRPHRTRRRIQRLRSHPVFQQSRNLRAKSYRRFRRRRQKFAHRRRQRPRRRSGTRHRSRRRHRARRTNRCLFRAQHRSRLHRRNHHGRPRRDAEAFHHFHQLGRPGRFLDRPIAQRTEFRLPGCINNGRHSPRSFGR